jgi:hypothetical protein
MRPWVKLGARAKAAELILRQAQDDLRGGRPRREAAAAGYGGWTTVIGRYN